MADSQQSMASRAIRQAKVLEAERQATLEKVNKNRELLRLLDDNGELTEPEGKWLDVFYPTRVKGGSSDKDAAEATRKLRAAGVAEVSK